MEVADGKNPNYEIINLNDEGTVVANCETSVDFGPWIPTIVMGSLAVVFVGVFFMMMGAINKLKKS